MFMKWHLDYPIPISHETAFFSLSKIQLQGQQNKAILRNFMFPTTISDSRKASSTLCRPIQKTMYTCRQNVWYGWPVYEVKCLCSREQE